MKRKNLLVASLVLLTAGAALVSCGGEEKPNPSDGGTTPSTAQPTKAKEIKVWCAPEDIPFVEMVAKNFKADPANAKFKDAKINVVETNEPDVANGLKNDLNAAADVFHYPGDGLGNFVTLDYLYQIPEMMVKNIGIEEEVLKAGQISGKQYGIPFTPNTYFMYYDASVYTEDDVTSLNKMLAKDVSSAGYDYNFGIDLANGWYAQSYYFSNGCTIFGEDGLQPAKGIEPKEKGLHVANWMWDFMNGPQRSKLFANKESSECGKTVAAYVSGTWDANKIKENITKKGGTYAAAPLPKVDFGDGEVAWKSVRDFKHIGVKSITAEPELSCKFAAYLANKESQTLRYKERKTAPTNLEAANDPNTEWDAAIVAQTKQLANQFAQPTIYDNQKWWDSCTELGTDLLSAEKVEIADYFNNFLKKITVVKTGK